MLLREQLTSNGKMITAGSMTIAGSGLDVQGGGLKVNSGVSMATGDSNFLAGSVSLTSTASTASSVDVYSTLSSLGADSLITARVPAGTTSGNLMCLLEGTNVLFRVSV